MNHERMVRRVAIVCGTLAGGFAHAAHAQSFGTHSIERVGLVDSEHTFQGQQHSNASLLSASGLVAGTSFRYARGSGSGQSTWVFDPSARRTVRTGLFGGEHSGDVKFQYSENVRANDHGQVVGFSYRFADDAAINGQSAWVYEPESAATIQLGLLDQAHVGAHGYHVSGVIHQNAAGYLIGFSNRITGVDTFNGQDIWLYRPDTGVLTTIGLSDVGYTMHTGLRRIGALAMNARGQVIGTSSRFISVPWPAGTTVWAGEDAWIYDADADTTTRIGLVSPRHEYEGFRHSEVFAINDSGQVAGVSWRPRADSPANGMDTWVYKLATAELVQTGLTGGVYTASSIRQLSANSLQNAAGQVVGYSHRMVGGGQDTWFFNPDTNATTRIGLSGGPYTGVSGYQFSDNELLNESGQVAGHSRRVTAAVGGGTVDMGNDTWVYDPVSNTTVQTGLTSANGRHFSWNTDQSESGFIAGHSEHATSPGTNTWLYNPTTRATVQTGLTGPAHTGELGYQTGGNDFLNELGDVAGFSDLILDEDKTNGTNTWVYRGATGQTLQTGLTDPIHTGSNGYQQSVNQFQNQSGHTVGYSIRITGAHTPNGRDVWYFDPATGQTHAVVSSVRASDSYAFSMPVSLTDDGILLGYYTYFANNAGEGEPRAFAYRPDLGLSDLGAIVDRGLAAAGWSSLSRPVLPLTFDTIVGHGLVTGQLGGHSVFVLTGPACPPCSADYDRDGGVTDADVASFFLDFEQSSPCADRNGDGDVNASDIAEFVASYESGRC